MNSGAKEAPKIWSLMGWKRARIRTKVKGPWLGSGKQTGSRKPSRRENLALHITLCHRFKPWGHSCGQDRHGSCPHWFYRLL